MRILYTFCVSPPLPLRTERVSAQKLITFRGRSQGIDAKQVRMNAKDEQTKKLIMGNELESKSTKGLWSCEKKLQIECV